MQTIPIINELEKGTINFSQFSGLFTRRPARILTRGFGFGRPWRNWATEFVCSRTTINGRTFIAMPI